MHRILLFVCLTAAWPSTPGLAAIYKVVDEHGNVTYTDVAPSDERQATPVQLPAINTQEPVVLRSRPAPPEQEAGQADDQYTTAAIISPQEGFALPAGQQNMTVELALEPPLQQGHWVQILVDGAPTAPPAHHLVQSLSGLTRGMHFISAQVLDERGQPLIETAPITIHVQRASLAAPARGEPSPGSAAPSPRAPN